MGEAAPSRLELARGVLRRVEERAGGGPSPADPRVLPVAEPLAPLLPGGGLRRGSTVAVAAGPAPPHCCSRCSPRPPRVGRGWAWSAGPSSGWWPRRRRGCGWSGWRWSRGPAPSSGGHHRPVGRAGRRRGGRGGAGRRAGRREAAAGGAGPAARIGAAGARILAGGRRRAGLRGLRWRGWMPGGGRERAVVRPPRRRPAARAGGRPGRAPRRAAAARARRGVAAEPEVERVSVRVAG